MAMGNWDLLALDEKGKPTNGVFTSPAGVHVEIYKNWLYISDDKAWRKTSRFCESVVAQVWEGEIKYMDIEIHAIRGPKEGIYFALWTEKEAMIGCGIYGFTERGQWVGVRKNEMDFLYRWLHSFEYDYMELKKRMRWPLEKGERIVYKDGKRWLKTREYLFEENIRDIKFSKALRVNQGNLFFAAHVKGFPVEATPPKKTKGGNAHGD